MRSVIDGLVSKEAAPNARRRSQLTSPGRACLGHDGVRREKEFRRVGAATRSIGVSIDGGMSVATVGRT